MKSDLSYLRTKSGVIAGIVEDFGKGNYTISRKPLNRTDFVNLGRDFSTAETEIVRVWLLKRDAAPSWTEWKKFLRNL